MTFSMKHLSLQHAAGPVLRWTPHAKPIAGAARIRRRRVVQVSAFRGSEPESKPSFEPLQKTTSAQHNSTLTLTELVAQPSITWTCLTGFCLVAAGVFIPGLQTDPSSGGNGQASVFARLALQLLSNEGAAAQAADTSSILLQAPAVASQLVASASADPAAEQLPSMVAAVARSPVLEIDQVVHNFVVSHTTFSWRASAADIYISDSFIAAGIAGWLLCTAVCLATNAKKAAGPLALSWAFYFMTCGAVGHGDPWLVDLLKNTFARVRPSNIHHTFSFPSGHTSAAVFIAGGLVAVLLPLTMQLLVEKGILQDSKAAQSSSSTADSNNDTEAERSDGDGSSLLGGLSRLDLAAIGFWGAAWGTTAVGRVLADAHWVSDTLAGGLLSVAVVSALAQSAKVLEGVSTASVRSTGREE